MGRIFLNWWLGKRGFSHVRLQKLDFWKLEAMVGENKSIGGKKRESPSN
jgi:hypothetical protein